MLVTLTYTKKIVGFGFHMFTSVLSFSCWTIYTSRTSLSLVARFMFRFDILRTNANTIIQLYMYRSYVWFIKQTGSVKKILHYCDPCGKEAWSLDSLGEFFQHQLRCQTRFYLLYRSLFVCRTSAIRNKRNKEQGWLHKNSKLEEKEKTD